MTKSKSATRKIESLCRHAAELVWGLDDEEIASFNKYLRGPQRCEQYDFLPSRIRAAVDDLSRYRETVRRAHTLHEAQIALAPSIGPSTAAWLF